MKNKKFLKEMTRVLGFAEVLYGIWNAYMFIFVIFTLFFKTTTLEGFIFGPIYFGTLGYENSISVSTPWYISILFLLISFTGYLLLRKVHKFFKNVTKGNIFVIENAKSLRWMGYYLLVFVVLNDVTDFLRAKLLLPYLKIKEVTVEVHYNASWTYIFGVLAFIVVGYIFKLAVEAVEENEKTI